MLLRSPSTAATALALTPPTAPASTASASSSTFKIRPTRQRTASRTSNGPGQLGASGPQTHARTRPRGHRRSQLANWNIKIERPVGIEINTVYLFYVSSDLYC